jgi:putative PIN family toxin of toxin-antitoxin system
MKSIKSSIASRVVVDTNVFVSALIWGGNPGKVIELWQKGTFILLLSPFLLTEILLTLERFGFSQGDLKRLQLILERHSFKLTPSRAVSVCRDNKDNQILDLCLVGKADYLITGDKDLLVLQEFQGTKIVEPKKYLDLLRSA